MEKNKKLFNKIIKLEKSKNSYFVNLSHELRTPLNVLHTTEQLITKLNKDGDLEEEKLDYYMSVMRRNNIRLLKLINNLIDISKMEDGKYSIIKKEVDIVYLVEEAALSLNEYIKENAIWYKEDNIEEKIIDLKEKEIEEEIKDRRLNESKETDAIESKEKLEEQEALYEKHNQNVSDIENELQTARGDRRSSARTKGAD